jgi:hypothetical protein
LIEALPKKRQLLFGLQKADPSPSFRHSLFALDTKKENVLPVQTKTFSVWPTAKGMTLTLYSTPQGFSAALAHLLAPDE